MVVDLWAPWCGPCRTLGPIIEKVVDATEGAVALAKVNVDENPAISASFKVQSIPAVFALKEGKVVDGFHQFVSASTKLVLVILGQYKNANALARELIAATDDVFPCTFDFQGLFDVRHVHNPSLPAAAESNTAGRRYCRSFGEFWIAFSCIGVINVRSRGRRCAFWGDVEDVRRMPDGCEHQ